MTRLPVAMPTYRRRETPASADPATPLEARFAPIGRQRDAASRLAPGLFGFQLIFNARRQALDRG